MEISVNIKKIKAALLVSAKIKHIVIEEEYFQVKTHVIREVGDFLLAKIFIGYFGGLDSGSIWFEQPFITGSKLDDRNWKLCFVGNEGRDLIEEEDDEDESQG